MKSKAYYNLGNIFTLIDQPKAAAEMYQFALRLTPSDWQAKYNLERLYVFYPATFGQKGQEASLTQEPQTKDKTDGKDGAGNNSTTPGI